MVLDKPACEVERSISEALGLPDYVAHVGTIAARETDPIANQLLQEPYHLSYGATYRQNNVFVGTRLSKNKLRGKGILSVWWGRNRTRGGHCVAFENGIIYDGDREAPLPFTAWRRYFPSVWRAWHIRRVA